LQQLQLDVECSCVEESRLILPKLLKRQIVDLDCDLVVAVEEDLDIVVVGVAAEWLEVEVELKGRDQLKMQPISKRRFVPSARPNASWLRYVSARVSCQRVDRDRFGSGVQGSSCRERRVVSLHRRSRDLQPAEVRETVSAVLGTKLIGSELTL